MQVFTKVVLDQTTKQEVTRRIAIDIDTITSVEEYKEGMMGMEGPLCLIGHGFDELTMVDGDLKSILKIIKDHKKSKPNNEITNIRFS